MPDDPLDLDKLWVFLEGLGAYAQQETRNEIAKHLSPSTAIAPSPVALRLPAATRDFLIFAMARCFILLPQIPYAARAKCYVEASVLAHGTAQLAARALYVAWLQGQSKEPLAEDKLRPYYKPESKSGTLDFLTPRLQEAGLLSESEANDLRWLNKHRNRIVHGVIFGELEIPKLLATTVRAAQASLNAVLAAQRWLQESARSEPG